jgi:hypothetical protein
MVGTTIHLEPDRSIWNPRIIQLHLDKMLCLLVALFGFTLVSSFRTPWKVSRSTHLLMSWSPEVTDLLSKIKTNTPQGSIVVSP